MKSDSPASAANILVPRLVAVRVSNPALSGMVDPRMQRRLDPTPIVMTRIVIQARRIVI
jgi:hypothetical protein